jgi:hypothetical protein
MRTTYLAHGVGAVLTALASGNNFLAACNNTRAFWQCYRTVLKIRRYKQRARDATTTLDH